MRRARFMPWSHLLPPPVRGALAAGVVLRAWAALVSPGFYAMDCYFHVLHPAWQWLGDPDAPMPSTFRSAALPLVLHAVMKMATLLGVPDGAPLVHAAHVFMGMWSLLLIPLAWHITEPVMGRRAATAAAWLCAAQFMAPHIGTRTLVECAAAPPVLAAAYAVFRARMDAKHATLLSFMAGLALGTALLFRLHVALLAPVFGVLLLLRGDAAHRARRLAAYAAGGTLMVLVMGFVDLFTQGGFLVVPFRYIAYQRSFVDSYGVMPWYTLIAFLLALCVPPLLPAYITGAWDAARRLPEVSLPLAVYVAAHSLVGHKEERFVFTVLPFLFILLGVGLVHAWDSGARWRKAAVASFALLNTALLLVFTPAYPRRNSIDPLIDAAVKGSPRVAHGAGVRVPAAYLGRDGRAVEHDTTDAMLAALATETAPVLRIVVAGAQRSPSDEELVQAGYACGESTTWQTDLLDRLLVMANPKNNRSRLPSTSRDCSRTARTDGT